ncbi:MAG: hypothetical protein PHP70_00475 [Gallionella sp.]|nr:hypothetical protein [Gallionella sp.]
MSNLDELQKIAAAANQAALSAQLTARTNWTSYKLAREAHDKAREALEVVRDAEITARTAYEASEQAANASNEIARAAQEAVDDFEK